MPALVLDLLILLVFPVPYASRVQVRFMDRYRMLPAFYYLNDLFALYSLARVFIILKILLSFNRWFTARTVRLW